MTMLLILAQFNNKDKMLGNILTHYYSEVAIYIFKEYIYYD